jgi:uncharacterized repeat protein (TIGR02543 family)
MKRLFSILLTASLLVGSFVMTSVSSVAASTHTQKFIGPANSNQFGYSVDISEVSEAGYTVVIGDHRYDQYPAYGAAWVYTKFGGVWSEGFRIMPGVDDTAGRNSASFGWEVAISDDGNTIVIGCPDRPLNVRSGAAYVYVKSGTSWIQQGILFATAPDNKAMESFGSTVAIDGDTILVGAPGDGTNSQGAVYVFTRSDSVWNYQAKLTVANAIAWEQIGRDSISISNDTALIGDTSYAGGLYAQGAAYIFNRNGTSWSDAVLITDASGAMNDMAGFSVAIDGDTAVITSPYKYTEGAARFYVRNGANWDFQQEVIAVDGVLGDDFGDSVALNGNNAVVGSSYKDIGTLDDLGAAYLFSRSGSTWSLQAELLASDGAAHDEFGFSTALNGDSIIVGAIGDEPGGAAYIYGISPSTTYTLTESASPSAGGTVAKSPNQTTYNSGASVQLTANPVSGYHFVNWSGDAAGSANPVTITMDGNKTVTANFALNTFDITTSVPGSHGTATANPTSVISGGSSTVTLTPETGYHLSALTDNGTNVFSWVSSNTYTITNITANHTVEATFAINTYTLTADATNGSVTKNPDLANYNHGTTVQLTALAASGYHFVNWSGDATGSANPVTVIMNANKTVTANFAVNSSGTAKEQIQAIEGFFAAGIQGGSLNAVSSGKTGNGQLTAFGNMLKRAEYLIAQGDYAGAIQQLQDAYLKVDGKPNPPDFVKGSAATQLAQMIQDLITYLKGL